MIWKGWQAGACEGAEEMACQVWGLDVYAVGDGEVLEAANREGVSRSLPERFFIETLPH